MFSGFLCHSKVLENNQLKGGNDVLYQCNVVKLAILPQQQALLWLFLLYTCWGYVNYILPLLSFFIHVFYICVSPFFLFCSLHRWWFKCLLFSMRKAQPYTSFTWISRINRYDIFCCLFHRRDILFRYITCSMAYSLPATSATFAISSTCWSRSMSRQWENVRLALGITLMLRHSESSFQWRLRMPGFLRPWINGMYTWNFSIMPRTVKARAWQAVKCRKNK